MSCLFYISKFSHAWFHFEEFNVIKKIDTRGKERLFFQLSEKFVKFVVVWRFRFFIAITHFSVRRYMRVKRVGESNPNNEHVFLSVTIQKSQKESKKELEAETITDIAINTRWSRKFCFTFLIFFPFFKQKYDKWKLSLILWWFHTHRIFFTEIYCSWWNLMCRDHPTMRCWW